MKTNQTDKNTTAENGLGQVDKFSADLMEKLVDAHVSQTSHLEQINKSTEENTELLRQVIAFFSNGLRADLKDHAEELSNKQTEDIKTEINNYLKFWTKLAAFGMILLGTITAIIQVIKP